MDQLSIRLTQALSSDERLLWSGKPKIGKMFNKIDYFLLPFGAIWTFGGTLYLLMAIQVFRSESSGSIFEQVLNGMQITMMIPVILVGAYLLVIRFFVKAYIKKTCSMLFQTAGFFWSGMDWGPKSDPWKLTKLPPWKFLMSGRAWVMSTFSASIIM